MKVISWSLPLVARRLTEQTEIEHLWNAIAIVVRCHLCISVWYRIVAGLVFEHVLEIDLKSSQAALHCCVNQYSTG